VNGSTFNQKDWSVYGQAIRTNNNIEGWHNALNRRASGRVHLPFYMLIQLLHREAELIAIQVRLVSEKRLKRIQRKQYRKMQTKVFSLWQHYQDQEKSAMQLLKASSYLNGPIRQK
jgi:hypothetical protein